MQFDYKQRIATKVEDTTIGKLLDNLRMESVFYTNSQLSSPWALSMPQMHNCMMFHLMVEGQAEFTLDGQQQSLQEGDFILLPKGEGHVLSDGHCQVVTPLSELPIKQVTERYETLTFGGDGTICKMVCGALIFQHPLASKLLSVLPAVIHIAGDNPVAAGLVKSISELIKNEAENLAPGAEAVISRLADILVITAVRQYMESLDEDKLGWLGALEDDRIAKALTLIHDSPDTHWSLEELAANVGMSRTSFATQFKRLVGNSPIDYLSEWRMSLAFGKLQMTKQTILTIALDLGYQSEAAFSRAFKKIVGRSPSEVRKGIINHQV